MVLASVGFGTAGYAAYKGESRELWLPLTYFACMELLQAATYAYIDQCEMPQNQILTLLGYLHITFQPFFVNMVAMYFIPQTVKERLQSSIYALCCLGALAMLIKMYPFPWARICVKGYEGFCGPTLCSLSGDWHIAWQMPLNGLMSNYLDNPIPFQFGLHGFAYFAVSFGLPLFYGSWRFVAFHLAVGPLLADLLTRHPNEHAAVWCLLSIGLCVSVIKTPLRRHLRVERWLFYPNGRLFEAFDSSTQTEKETAASQASVEQSAVMAVHQHRSGSFRISWRPFGHHAARSESSKKEATKS